MIRFGEESCDGQAQGRAYGRTTQLFERRNPRRRRCAGRADHGARASGATPPKPAPSIPAVPNREAERGNPDRCRSGDAIIERRRLHGRRDARPGHRACRRLRRLELPGLPRIADQLRHAERAETRSPVLHARRSLGRDVPWLCQDRRQADGGDDARHRRPAAWLDGDLQRLCRPGADLPDHPGCARRAHPQDHGALRPFGAGWRGHGARFRQMG